MSPFLRGGSADTRPEIKGVREFSKSNKDITNDDKKKFHLAINEHIDNNHVYAKKIYKELLIKYENNEVIKYNLNLI